MPSAKILASASVASAAWRRTMSRVLPGGRTQPDGVELLADAEVADLVGQPERQGAGPGGQVQQVGRGQRHAGRAEELLDEVGLQALLEQAEPGAGTDIGAQRDADAVR